MSRNVQVAAGKKNVHLPNGGRYDGGTTVTLTEAEFAQIAATAFSGGTLVDLGPAGSAGDTVYTQGTAVAAPPALTSAAAVAAPTKAEYDALRADVAALRTTVAALITALTGAGKPLAP